MTDICQTLSPGTDGGALQCEHSHHAGLLCERHARCLTASRRAVEATNLLRQAVRHYEARRAATKVKALSSEIQRAG